MGGKGQGRYREKGRELRFLGGLSASGDLTGSGGSIRPWLLLPLTAPEVRLGHRVSLP